MKIQRFSPYPLSVPVMIVENPPLPVNSFFSLLPTALKFHADRCKHHFITQRISIMTYFALLPRLAQKQRQAKQVCIIKLSSDAPLFLGKKILFVHSP